MKQEIEEDIQLRDQLSDEAFERNLHLRTLRLYDGMFTEDDADPFAHGTCRIVICNMKHASS